MNAHKAGVLQTWGFASILLTPSTKCERNFARSALLKRDLLTEAIWTRHDNTCTQTPHSVSNKRLHTLFLIYYHHMKYIALTNGERDGGMEWYKLKKSCRVEESRNAERQKQNRGYKLIDIDDDPAIGSENVRKWVQMSSLISKVISLATFLPQELFKRHQEPLQELQVYFHSREEKLSPQARGVVLSKSIGTSGARFHTIGIFK